MHNRGIMRTILYMAVTINGYVAGEDGDTSWVVSSEEWKSFEKIANDAGNIVIGRRTYEIMSAAGELGKFQDYTVVVVTSRELSILPKFAIAAKSPKEALEKLQKKGFKKAVVAGGGSLNSSFLKEKLIDEIYVDVEPYILGRGIPLFKGDEIDQRLKLLAVNKFSGDTVQLHYKFE